MYLCEYHILLGLWRRLINDMLFRIPSAEVPCRTSILV